MSIFPASRARAEGLVITWILSCDSSFPFIHLSSSNVTANCAAVGSRKQMEPCPSSDQKKTKEAVLALQRLMCRRYKHAASVYVSCSLRRFQVSRQKGGQAVTPLRKPFLKELGSAALLCWPPKCLGSEIRGEWKEELEDTYVIPCPLPSVFCDQVSYARGFRALLSAANSRWDGGSESSRLVMPLIRHYNPCPGCLAGHISQLSLRIHQRRACMAYKHARFKQHSAAYYSPWWMPGSGLDVLEELNSTPVSIQQAVFEISSDKVK